MEIYNVIAEGHSRDNKWTCSLIGASASLEAAQEYLEPHDYRQIDESGRRQERSWETSASIVEVPPDNPNMEMLPVSNSRWSVTA